MKSVLFQIEERLSAYKIFKKWADLSYLSKFIKVIDIYKCIKSNQWLRWDETDFSVNKIKRKLKNFQQGMHLSKNNLFRIRINMCGWNAAGGNMITIEGFINIITDSANQSGWEIVNIKAFMTEKERKL